MAPAGSAIGAGVGLDAVLPSLRAVRSSTHHRDTDHRPPICERGSLDGPIVTAESIPEPVAEGGRPGGAQNLGPDYVVFDPSVLAGLVNGDQEKIARLGRKFIDTTRASVEQMLDAVREGDHERVGRLAHSLKSAAATVGAPGLASANEELEAACERGETDVVGPLVTTIAARAESVARELLGTLGEKSW